MGIPAYFRWISAKFPRIMVDCVEHLVTNPGCPPVPPSDISGPNPNGVEFDNLYLDMNGIIHPCTHPEDAPPPTTEQEMFDAVNEYIDRIMAIVRPRKILYMAVDGVAPRAKINQQRSRRFRAAKEAEHKAREAEALKREWEQKGLKVASLPDSSSSPNDSVAKSKENKVDGKNVADKSADANGKHRNNNDDDDAPFDSNVITPGTPFMERLAVSLREYVANRVSSTPGWENLRIIFSDASVPGEGEHKIAEFVRVERATPGFDPNIRHVLYGLDADLIMLALATHELHFSVLREEVFPKNGGQRDSLGGGPSLAAATNGPIEEAPMDLVGATSTPKSSNQLSTRAELGGKKPFHFLHVHILREYLDLEFRHDLERELAAAARHPRSGAPANLVYDLENVIDDFVFLCFFVGNDFLPHLPTLDIREGAVDYIIEVYKTDLPHVGYLTSGAGDVDFGRVRKMMSRIGTKEDEVFQERKQREMQSLNRAAEDRKRAADYKARQAGQQQRKEAPDVPLGVAIQVQTRTIDLPNDVSMNQSETQPLKDVVAHRSKSKTGGVNGKSATGPLDPPPPSDEDLVALGDKNKGARVGDGSANKAAAARLRSAIEMKKHAVAGKSKRSLGVGSVGIVKTSTSPRSAGGTASRAALAALEDLPVASDPRPPINYTEKQLEDFQEELKNRLRQQNEIKEPVDNVRLGDEGWKDRYYKNKFNWGEDDVHPKQQMFRSYVEGLYWVMKYYYVGCISWVWYYPYHYAPFASDIVNCDTSSEDINLEMGKPFPPFTQLQAVMPASSGALVLPKCYSRLMTDSNSPIIEYYPDEFEIDLNGKRFAWQGVALLPFIEEKRLQDALANLDHLLNKEERKRNSFGECVVIAHQSSSLGKYIEETRKVMPSAEHQAEAVASGGSSFSAKVPESVAEGQLFGTISPREPTGEGMSLAVVAQFDLPERLPHITKLLPGVQAPPRVLDVNMEERGRSGWKAARFGSLGRAAKVLSEERESRLSGRRRTQPGDFVAAPYQQHVSFAQQGGTAHPVAAAMFGGLGGNSVEAPSWIRQSHPAAPWQQQQQYAQYQQQQQVLQHSYQHHQGQQSLQNPRQRQKSHQQQAQERYQQQQQQQQQLQQQQYYQYQHAYGSQFLYGQNLSGHHQDNPTQGYGGPAGWGGVDDGGGASAYGYGYDGSSSGGASMHQNSSGMYGHDLSYSGDGGGGGGGGRVGYSGADGIVSGTDGYRFSTNPAHYTAMTATGMGAIGSGSVGATAVGRMGGGGGGGGLAGPTAMQMRQGSSGTLHHQNARPVDRLRVQQQQPPHGWQGYDAPGRAPRRGGGGDAGHQQYRGGGRGGRR